MKIKLSLIALLSILFITFGGTANAQDLSLRGEVGLTTPITSPQIEAFQPGLAIALKPEVTVASGYLGLGPSLGWSFFPSGASNTQDGTFASLGGFARVKRPHDNDGSYFGASPYAEADLAYYRTGALDRVGAGAQLGVELPLNESKSFWYGPYINYSVINQDDSGHPSYINTNSAKIFTIGLSFELETAHKQTSAKNYDEVVYYVPEQKKEALSQKDEVKKPEPLTFTAVVQFPFDSSVLAPTENKVLYDVLEAATKDTSSKIKLEGHSSSEGNRHYNLKLSQRRADTVKSYLVANGISADRITAVGMGIDYPVSPNNNETNRSKNRRATFNVVFTFQK